MPWSPPRSRRRRSWRLSSAIKGESGLLQDSKLIGPGPGSLCLGRYYDRTLTAGAKAITTWSQQGREVFCPFDNDEAGFAAHNALELPDLLLKG